jgi:hypothetical protein
MTNLDILFSFFAKNNYQLVEKSYSPQFFGNYHYTFSNSYLVFRIVHDRSNEFIEMSCVTDKNRWHDMDILKCFLLYNNDLNKITDMNIDESISFLMDNFDVITQLFSKKNYNKTFSELDTLKLKRVRLIWGDDFILSE